MSKRQKNSLFFLLILITLAFFVLDLAWGSIRIPLNEIFSIFAGKGTNNIHTEIILNFRLPKAITAIIAGISLSIAGLMMQTLFRNPLADPYILGISSGASLGAAMVMMAASLFPAVFISSSWSLIIAAVIGASLVLLLVILVSFKVHDVVSLLIVGIMFGTIASALVNIFQNLSNPDAVKLFIMWTFGSLSAVTWHHLLVLIPVFLVGMMIAIFLQKRLDVLLLGENYARSSGVSIQQTRFLIVLATGLLAGGVTAFTGPIAFVGVAIPHIARGIFRTSSHKILIPACVLCGASLLMICDIISQIPAYSLPINTVSALFGAPVILWIILKRK